MQPSGRESAFIRNVLLAIERDGRGEAWVREQFRAFTDGFLREVLMETEQGRDLKHAHKEASAGLPA